MAVMCNSCSKPLRGSKHYEVICRDATEHEDRIKEIDEMQNKSKRAEEHEKEKMIDELKKALRKLTSEELDEEEEKLREEIAQLRAEIEDLDLDKENEDKDTKQERESRLEHIGYDSSPITKSSYSVLALEPYYNDKVSADELFVKLGSTGSQTKGNSKDDEFLKSLGSAD